jgi:hypothetical protein
MRPLFGLVGVGVKRMTEFEITNDVYFEYVCRNPVKEIVTIFHREVGSYLEHVNQFQLHRRRSNVFFMLHDSCVTTTLPLCNSLSWCKHSDIKKQLESSNKFHAVMVNTCFGGCVVVARALSDAEANKCSIFFTCANKSVQLNVRRKKGFIGSCLIGVSVATPNICFKCGVPASLSLKLRMCSRCFKVDRARVLYCSAECQRVDYYARHRNACKYDWNSDDWINHTMVCDSQEC